MQLWCFGHHLKSPNPRFFPIFLILRKLQPFYHLGTCIFGGQFGPPPSPRGPLPHHTQVHMAVTFVCVEKKRRELDEKKSLDLLFNMGTTCFFSLPKLKVDFGCSRLVVKFVTRNNPNSRPPSTYVTPASAGVTTNCYTSADPPHTHTIVTQRA